MSRSSLLLIGLLVPSAVLAQTELRGGKYILEGISIGNETILSAPTVSKPTIVSGPTTTKIDHRSVEINWQTDKPTSSIVLIRRPGNSTAEEQGRGSEYVTAHRVRVIGLEPGNRYEFTVRSSDQLGNAIESTPVTATTDATAEISTPIFDDLTNNSLIVSFTTKSIVNASIRYGTTSEQLTGEVADQSTSLTTNHTLRIGNLTEGTTYFLQIITTSEIGTVHRSDLFTVSTLPKPSISTVAITVLSANEVTVGWRTNIETDSQVEYSTNSSKPIEGLSAGKKKTQGSADRTKSHTVTLAGLAGNTTYQAQILGHDANGNRVVGSPFTFRTAADNAAPIIDKQHIETAAGRGGRIKAIISWSTNEPTTTVIRYGSDGLDQERANRQLLSTTHLVSVPDLRPATTYRFVLESQDGAGNTTVTDPITLLTPAKRRSVIEIFLQKLEENFGWLRRIF